MKCYAIAEMDITDPSWVQEYVERVTPLVEARGGRFLARTLKAEKLEGERETSQIYLLIEWPSREAAVEFYESEEYRPYREARVAGARNELVLVAGEDVTGMASLSD
jgi:uncharacterized protein (DUF1330 family)